MSKSQKGNCSFVMTRGPKKGQQCNKSCRGKLCKDHNKNRQKYVKTYNSELGESLKKASIMAKIEKLKNDQGNPIDISKERLKAALLSDEISEINRKIFGCMLVLDPEFPIPHRKKILDELNSQDYIDECRESYDFSHKKGLKFDDYLEEKRSDILADPDSLIRFIPFEGSAEKATEKINKLKAERLIIRNKLENQLFFIKEYEKYREELRKEITTFKKKKVIEV